MSGLPGNRPLSDNMRGVLATLLQARAAYLDGRPGTRRGYPMTPNAIAMEMGITEGGRRMRGPWSGNMAPAQRIISALTALTKRGLIEYASRPDERSGSAYRLSDEGLVRARELAREDTRFEL